MRARRVRYIPFSPVAVAVITGLLTSAITIWQRAG